MTYLLRHCEHITELQSFILLKEINECRLLGIYCQVDASLVTW